jgi:hypothetical protein
LGIINPHTNLSQSQAYHSLQRFYYYSIGRHDSLTRVHSVRQLALDAGHSAQHILAMDENTLPEGNFWKNV